MIDIPVDIMKAAEEALDKMLCNCRESCGGTNEGLRAASIADIARAIMAEREAHIAKMDEVCSVSFADHNAATELLREFTGTEGGVIMVDWYALRDRIADATSMARVEERYKCRFALSEAEKREREARAKALEEAAAVVDLVVEKTPWLQRRNMAIRIARSIRALQSEER